MSESFSLGRYRVIRRIATGGMADVYEAKLTGVHGFEKTVAIKKILPHWSRNPEFIRMMIAEAKLLLTLNHPNIVQVIELNKDDEDYYLVMEYVEGADLKYIAKELLDRGIRMSTELILYLAQEITKGLGFAHGRVEAIIHRDISPQNILMSHDGAVKITDFGIAKVMGQSSHTITGTLKGKFAYMSPEQARGQRLSPATDIFSLGLVLFELATGRKGFEGSSDLELIEKVRAAQINFPDDWAQYHPGEFQQIIAKCLAKDPMQRFASALELSERLERFERGSGQRVDHGALQVFLTKNLSWPDWLGNTLNLPTRVHADTVPDSRSNRKARIELIDSETLEAGERKTKILKPEIMIAQPITEGPVNSAGQSTPWGYWGSIVGVALFVLWGLIEFRNRIAQRPEVPAITLPSPAASVTEPTPVMSVSSIPATFAGLINVGAVPEDASIRISFADQVWEGKGHLILTPELTAPSAYHISVVRQDYQPITVEVLLTAVQPSFRKNFLLTKQTFATLKVSARPWGQVYLGKLIQGNETPMVRTKIPVGPYQLRVSYPPLKQSVSQNIELKPDQVLQCQARFGNQSTIHCL